MARLKDIKAGQQFIEDDGFAERYIALEDAQPVAGGYELKVRSLKDDHEDVFFESNMAQGYALNLIVVVA